MKRRKVLSLILVVMMAAVFAVGCGARGGGDGGGASGEEPIVIKIGHSDSETRATNVSALEFKDFMEEKTDGRVTVEVYPNGQLGEDDDIVKGVKLGTCQIFIGTQGSVSSVLGEKYDVLDLPFLYNSYEEWCDGMLSEGGGLDLYNELLEGTGYVALDFAYDGQRSILTTKKPIRSLADMKGLKIRVTPSEMYLSIFKAMGANPTPMAFGEVYTGLTQGTIDGLDHSATVIVDQKFQEPSKYFTLTNHMTSPQPILTSQAFLDSLPQDVHDIFLEGIAKMGERQRELEHSKEAECLQTMKDDGIEVIELNDEQLAEFVKAVQPVYNQWREYSGDEAVDRMLATSKH